MNGMSPYFFDTVFTGVVLTGGEFFDYHLGVLVDSSDDFVDIAARPNLNAGQKFFSLLKNPGIPEGAATNHDAGWSVVFNPIESYLRSDDVTTTDHRDIELVRN